MESHNYYHLLGCNETATYEEIKKNFQELALKWHPDKHFVSDKSDLVVSEEGTSEEFVLIMEAWNTLRDEKKRKIYDSTLMRQKCDIQNAVYAQVSWDDLEYDGSVYSFKCRCGDTYSVDSSERTCNEEISVQCNGCSLEIIILSEK